MPTQPARRASALAALAALASSALLAACLTACHGGEDASGAPTRGLGASLSVKGSDTMVILAQRWAEGFAARGSHASIQVSGGGSGAGIAALRMGMVELACASRAMNDRERRALREERGLEPHETRVALDAITVYVHRDNPIASLSIAELGAIYRGQVTRWSELGGPDHAIILYSRENNSGTYAYFKEHVLEGADLVASAQTLPGTAAVIHAVSLDPWGIGYGGIGYAQGVRPLAISRADGAAVTPTLENVTSGDYPLWRPLYVYSLGTPGGLTAEFLSFITSSDGQHLVEEAGFYPLPTLLHTTSLSRTSP